MKILASDCITFKFNLCKQNYFFFFEVFRHDIITVRNCLSFSHNENISTVHLNYYVSKLHSNKSNRFKNQVLTFLQVLLINVLPFCKELQNKIVGYEMK